MIKATIDAAIFDPVTKELLKEYPPKEANTLVANFIKMLFIQMSQTPLSLINYLGSGPMLVGPGLGAWDCNDPASVGLFVGSSGMSINMLDYSLKAPLVLTWGANTVSMDDPDASTWRLKISKVFTNNTGNPVAISEVCLRSNQSVSIFLWDRTLYSVVLPNATSTTITYKIWITL